MSRRAPTHSIISRTAREFKAPGPALTLPLSECGWTVPPDTNMNNFWNIVTNIREQDVVVHSYGIYIAIFKKLIRFQRQNMNFIRVDDNGCAIYASGPMASTLSVYPDSLTHVPMVPLLRPRNHL